MALNHTPESKVTPFEFIKSFCCSISCVSIYDEDMTKSKDKDPLEGLGGPMTRARARKAKETLQQVLSILFEYKPKFQGEKSKVVSCTMAQMEED